MDLKFKIYELKESSFLYKSLEGLNEFIAVGTDTIGEYECFKVLQLDEGGLAVPKGLDIDLFSTPIPKSSLKLKSQDGLGYSICTLDIPKEKLTMDIIENIQKLNS